MRPDQAGSSSLLVFFSANKRKSLESKLFEFKDFYISAVVGCSRKVISSVICQLGKDLSLYFGRCWLFAESDF